MRKLSQREENLFLAENVIAQHSFTGVVAPYYIHNLKELLSIEKKLILILCGIENNA